MSEIVGITASLSAQITQLAWSDLGDDDVNWARACLLDWYGCAIAGSRSDVAIALCTALADEIGAGRSRLISSFAAAPPRVAALVNGTMSHSIELDDIYAPGLFHPGCPIIAAADAVGFAAGSSDRDLVLAIIAGYEVGNRIAAAVNPHHYEHWHTTGTVGVFGAAAAAARLLKLGREQTGHALGLAATLASGLREGFGGDTKPLHAGRAAEGGVLAALGARSGMVAPATMLEGAAGFGAATSRDVDWRGVETPFSAPFSIARTTQKLHACCGHAFAALDALAALRTSTDVNDRSIDRIEIGTYQQAVDILGKRDPATANEGRFSLPFCAALMVSDGIVSEHSFRPERLSDPGLRAIAASVHLFRDPGMDGRFPARRGAQVLIRLRNGQQHTMIVDDRRGSPEWPLTERERQIKFLGLAQPIIGVAAAEAMLKRFAPGSALACDVSEMLLPACRPTEEKMRWR